MFGLLVLVSFVQSLLLLPPSTDSPGICEVLVPVIDSFLLLAVP